MNGRQRERILEELNRLLRKSNRLEKLQDKAEADGDEDKVRRLEEKIGYTVERIDGIAFACATMGWDVKYRSDEEKEWYELVPQLF